MTFSITSFVRTYCLCAFLLFAALGAQGKEKIETPNKRTEGARSRSIPTLHIPWVSPHHPLLSKPSLPLSLDPIRFTLQATQPTVAVGEEVEITITAQLLDIPASAFFIFEEQKSFSIKLLLPQGFTQTGGDYQEYIGAQLTTQNNTFTKRIRGVFTSLPENLCFALLRGAYHANASSVFEQKQILCLSKKNTPKATRVADCTAPVLTPITAQTICYGGGFYMVSTSVTNGVEVYYQWYNDNGAANNNTNPIAGEERANLRSFPTAPGVYKYRIVATSSAGSSCSASESVTLTVYAPPTITSTTGTNPSCAPTYGGTISVIGAGGTALMYSKDDGGNWVDLTGINAQDEITRNAMLYTTENDVARVKITLEEGFGLGPGGEYKGEIRNGTITPVFDGLAAGTYKIRVKNENGCISEAAPVTLTNPNAPAIFNVTGGGTCVANGAPIDLSGSSTGVNYSLLRNGVTVTAGVAGTGNALSFGNHTTEGTYTVTATNTTTNCSAVMTNSAVVSNVPPVAPIIDTETTVVCASQSAVLTTNSSCAGTLVWTPSGGTLTNNNHTYTVAPTTATTYSAKCQINSCISDVSNSIQLTVTTLSAPVIDGESPRTLCPDNPVTLVATGCSATVAWSYTLTGGATGTLAFTGNTLELTFADSGISAWNAGDVLSLRAACTTPTCTSSPSVAVEVVKQASCSTALADCAFYIKAADAQGTETSKLTRTGAGAATYQPLTLSAMTLEATTPTGVTYSWTGPGISTPLTTAQISATQVGEYKLVLTPPSGVGGLGPCELYITLSGTPCTIPASAACGVPVTITPSDQGGPYLTALAPGDQFTANDYVITVTSVTSSTAGAFVGEGYSRMKLTNGFSIDVPVVFGQANGSGSTTTATPIKLNTCYQLVDGTVFTQYDPSWGNIADVDVLIEDFQEFYSVGAETLRTLISTFGGTCQEVEQISTQITAIETALTKDDENTPERKQELQTQLNNLKTAFEQLKSCANCAIPAGLQRNARIATDPEECGRRQKACLDKVDEIFETLKKTIADGDVQKSLEKLYIVYKYVQTTIEVCGQTGWMPYDEGIVPLCLWRTAPPTSAFSANDPAFVAGIVDGGFVELKEQFQGIANLPAVLRETVKVIDAYTSAYLFCNLTEGERAAAVTRLKAANGEFYWSKMIDESLARENKRCSEAATIRKATKDYLTQFADYITNAGNIATLITTHATKLNKYINTTANNPDAEFRYNQGRILGRAVVLFGSLGVGSGEIKLVGQAVKNGITALPDVLLGTGKKLNIRKLFAQPLAKRKEVGAKIKNNPSNNPAQYSEFIDTEANLASSESSLIINDLASGGISFPTSAVTLTPGGAISKAQLADFGKDLILLPTDIARIKTTSGSIAAIAEEAVYNKINSVRPNLKKWNTKFHGDSDNGLDLVLTENVPLAQLKEVIVIDIKSSITQKVPHTQTLGRGYGGFIQLSDNYLFGVDESEIGGIVREMLKSVYASENVSPTARMLLWVRDNNIPIRKYIVQIDKDGVSKLVKID